MTNLTDIKPDIKLTIRIVTRSVSRTQCSWTVKGYEGDRYISDQYKIFLKDKGMNFKLCPKWSTHIINNDHYCSMHAGVIVLKLLTSHGKDTP